LGPGRGSKTTTLVFIILPDHNASHLLTRISRDTRKVGTVTFLW